jgi:hypothetical protein
MGYIYGPVAVSGNNHGKSGEIGLVSYHPLEPGIRLSLNHIIIIEITIHFWSPEDAGG